MKNILSLKTKTILIFLAALIGSGFLLTSIAFIYFNTLKEHIVANAIQLAHEQGEQAAKEIRRIIEEENISAAGDLKNKEHLKSQLQILLKKNKNIVLAAFMDAKGKIVVEHLRKGKDRIEVIEPNKSSTTQIPFKDDGDWEIEVKKIPDNLNQIEFPIKKDNIPIGYLKYSVSQSKVYENISKTSARFSSKVISLIMALSFLLAVIFFLLWKVFSRHIKVLEEKDKLDKMAYVGTLASGLAHEIRNPLNVMQINLDLVSEDLEKSISQKDKDSLDMIKLASKQVRHLNGVLESFLKFALRQPIKKEPADFVALIKETVEFFENDYKRKEIICVSDLPDSMIINIDENKIRQVLTNILVNSMQAMSGQEKKIFINLFKKDEEALLTVTDTGTGFPEGKVDECFDVFFTTKENGSGFGLAIAKKIVEEHNGSITAQNVSPHGARITISLPL